MIPKVERQALCRVLFIEAEESPAFFLLLEINLLKRVEQTNLRSSNQPARLFWLQLGLINVPHRLLTPILTYPHTRKTVNL